MACNVVLAISHWRVDVTTLVSLNNTLDYNCFSSPTIKWVPVRAVMLVNDIAWYATYLSAQAVYSWLKE